MSPDIAPLESIPPPAAAPAHVTGKDVEELRLLVEPAAAQERADARDARIAGSDEARTAGSGNMVRT